MIKGHRIAEFEEAARFVERMSCFSEASIECTAHAFFRLSEKQRKLFTCGELKRFLLSETPLKVGVQRNGNYAVYYRHEEKTLAIKIILDLKPALIRIVTFYIVDSNQIPK